RVWISEVMLQQTQVAVVIPYFERWMEVFPTIEALAQAPLEQVLKCWEGLGYYSRARNLHLAAKQIAEHFGAELPSTAEMLAEIPGIGPYTRGALLSFAFRQKAAAVDGNVLRVLSRFLACQEEIDAPHVKKRLHAYAEAILPNEQPWLVSEGLIELGALVCAKKAKCNECPLRKECGAYRHGLQDLLPKKRARPQTIELVRQVAVIRCGKRYAVQKGASGKVMADLYEFPYLEGESAAKLAHHFEAAWGLKLHYQRELPEQRHSFTRYRARLFPHLLEATHAAGDSLWKTLEEIEKLPFSSGHKRILTELKS
ncbi:A/G-specific adenine glycosylase, partial [Chlamydiota bacterium]